MDLAPLQTQGPRIRRWPGRRQLVGLIPLPASQIDTLERRARDRAAALDVPFSPIGALHFICEVAAAAVVDPDTGEPLACVSGWADETPGDLSRLIEAWAAVQEAVTPPFDAVVAEILLRHHEKDGRVTQDIALASDSDSAAAFWGKAAALLTPGELRYYFALLEARERLTPTAKGKHRCLNLERLKSLARRSPTTGSPTQGGASRRPGRERRAR